MMDKSKTPRRDCRSCRYLTLCRGVFGFVYHSIAILHHEVPNPSLTIRNFCIAVRPLALAANPDPSGMKKKKSNSSKKLS
jgi:hypothetical protein